MARRRAQRGTAGGRATGPGSADRDDRYDREHETAAERLDRNWNELLQELRVTQTGVQILTGFLLTLPFQERSRTSTTTSARCTSCSWSSRS